MHDGVNPITLIATDHRRASIHLPSTSLQKPQLMMAWPAW
jgi:hypothetical protein